jgi:hypothetical protein
VTKLLLVLIATSTGCLWLNEKSDGVVGYHAHAIIDNGGHAGGGAEAVVGMAGVYVAGEGGLQPIHRTGDPNTYTAGAMGVSMRASPFGIIASDHRLERYFDFGAEAGGTFMIAVRNGSATGAGDGWYGAWLELGTAPIGAGYLVLVGNVRRASMSDGWNDQTLFTVGIGYRERSAVGKLNIHD